MDLYLNYSLRKSRFPLNLTDRRTDISIYRVASLLNIGANVSCGLLRIFTYTDYVQ